MVYSLHFRHEKSKAQEGKVIALNFHRKLMEEFATLTEHFRGYQVHMKGADGRECCSHFSDEEIEP